ncbi:CueP family metal-binding protein [Aquibacillus kalidii]|uniref:CueP family metal-binding protein n=1 Tax=Aquibacillus kalidii TaxID=2762597 RepID=UPI0022A7C71C|nr:CueP family metal-binding protein [Aquibacillus kalidii]
MLAIFFLVVDPKQNVTNESDVEDIKQLVSDYSSRSITSKSASITSHEIIVTDNNDNKTTYELPKDEYFVSIAPYVDNTHPCEIHSLTGCQGEMVGEKVDVYIEDLDGNVIVDKSMTTESNGFIDLWVPRDQKYKITISQNGKVSESEFTTFEDDNTCITTMQLKESI